jgi:DNA-binding XRE family transcriptional regulator
MTITPAQCRAARELLALSQEALAKAAYLHRTSIIAFEKNQGAMRRNNLNAIQHALEAAGVEFTNGGEPGVKLRKGGSLRASDSEATSA